MRRQMLGGKIHRATVTEARIDYEGSITIDQDLMDAAQIYNHEKVLIANLTNGARIESYAIPGPAGSGVICLNGGAAKHGKPGDLVIIMNFVVLEDVDCADFEPSIVHVDEQNKALPKSSVSV